MSILNIQYNNYSVFFKNGLVFCNFQEFLEIQNTLQTPSGDYYEIVYDSNSVDDCYFTLQSSAFTKHPLTVELQEFCQAFLDNSIIYQTDLDTLRNPPPTLEQAKDIKIQEFYSFVTTQKVNVVKINFYNIPNIGDTTLETNLLDMQKVLSNKINCGDARPFFYDFIGTPYAVKNVTVEFAKSIFYQIEGYLSYLGIYKRKFLDYPPRDEGGGIISVGVINLCTTIEEVNAITFPIENTIMGELFEVSQLVIDMEWDLSMQLVLK